MACYEAGYNAAMAGRPASPAARATTPNASRFLESGYADGRQTYDAYEGLY